MLIPENSNRLLLRQLNKAFPSGQVTDKGLDQFISLVSDAYTTNEEDRRLYSRTEKLANQELEQVNRELQIKNDFLDTFNHGMAHDIKNHTSNIIGLVIMLRKYYARDDKNMLKIIIDKLELSSNQLTAIVHGFLYLSRAEANIDNQFTLINEQEIINAVQAETLFLTIDKRCEINYNFNINNLFFSSHVIKIILVNLISNSLKFSSKNKITQISAQVNQHPHSIEISVTDNGIGMNLNDPNNKMFHLFNRGGGSKAVKGTGVGLFMIKKIVERHNGHVKVESEINKGTSFFITFPLS